MDAQSVKGADTVGAHSRGYDAGKKVNGRKRHIVVDTLGLLIVVLVTAASLQDRDGGRRILDRARMAMPSIALVWADGGYAGKLVAWVARYCRRIYYRRPAKRWPSSASSGTARKTKRSRKRSKTSVWTTRSSTRRRAV